MVAKEKEKYDDYDGSEGCIHLFNRSIKKHPTSFAYLHLAQSKKCKLFKGTFNFLIEISFRYLYFFKGTFNFLIEISFYFVICTFIGEISPLKHPSLEISCIFLKNETITILLQEGV